MADLKRYKASPVVSFKDEGDEGAVLYNPDLDKCVIVNAVGAAIWLYIEEPKTNEEIISMLKNKFSGVDVKKAREDLIQFVCNLEKDFINEIS